MCSFSNPDSFVLLSTAHGMLMLRGNTYYSSTRTSKCVDYTKMAGTLESNKATQILGTKKAN